MLNDDKNFLSRFVAKRLINYSDRKGNEYAARYGRNEDGTPDPALAHSIRREVHRRAAIGEYRDITEPVLWVGISTALVTLTGIWSKAAKNSENKTLANIALGVAGASLVGAAIHLVRPFLQYYYALKAGANTAIEMRDWDREHDPKKQMPDAYAPAVQTSEKAAPQKQPAVVKDWGTKATESRAANGVAASL